MMCCLELANVRHLFTFSAQRGYRPSMVKLGLIYYMGRGIEPDILRALHWFRLAADKGSRAACVDCDNVHDFSHVRVIQNAAHK